MVLQESCRRWDGGGSKPVEWTAEGGLNRELLPYYAPPGFSPVTKERRVTARRRAGGFKPPIWVAPQKFQDFCPKGTCQGPFVGWRSFFDAPPRKRPGFERSGRHGSRSVEGKSPFFVLRQLHFPSVRGKLVKLNRSRRAGTGQRGMSWKTRRSGSSAASSPAAS